MNINESIHCCGLLEIGDFSIYSTEENIIKTLKEYYLQEYPWNEKLPYAMFATTNQTQIEAEKALKALKFKATKFKSRHAEENEKTLTHWFRTTPPLKMKAWFNQLKKNNGE